MCPTTDLCNFQILAAIQSSICIPILLRLNCADHPTRWETLWLLIDFALRNSISRSARDIVFSILWKEKICDSCASRAQSKWWILTTKCKPIKRRANMATCYRHIYKCYHLWTVKLRQDERVDKPVGKFARRTIRERVRILQIATTTEILMSGEFVSTVRGNRLFYILQ